MLRSAKADEERRDVRIPHFTSEEMAHKVQHPHGAHTPNPYSTRPPGSSVIRIHVALAPLVSISVEGSAVRS